MDGVAGQVDDVVIAAIRAEMGAAIATLDGQRVADAVSAAIARELSPAISAGFVLTPGEPVEMRRFSVDAAWQKTSFAELDFRWMGSLLRPDVANGATTLGPDLHGLSQIAAAMVPGDGRTVCLFVAGDFADIENARALLSVIASEAGGSTQSMRRANTIVADSAALLERERLSRDLHDSLSQSLWSLSILSETAQSMTDPSDPLHAVVRQIAHLSLASQEEMRGLLINLRSRDPSEETIAGALESLVRDFRSSHQIEIVASIANADLDATSVMAFRRIAEEALNNVGRHAGAKGVMLLFDVHPVVSLRVIDDGCGFDTKPVEGHLGLRIMRERAAEAGCEFAIESSPGLGTVVTASTAPSNVGPIPWREPLPEPPSMTEALRFLMAGLLCAALALGGVFLGRRENSVDLDDAIDAATILEAQVATSRAAADEMNAMILQSLGVATAAEVDQLMAVRTEVVVDARASLEPLARPRSMIGERASNLLRYLESLSALRESENERLAALYNAAGPWDDGGRVTPATATPVESLIELAVLEQAVSFGLLEAAAAHYVGNPSGFDPTNGVSDFLSGVAEVVEDDGGYLGPNPAFPLRDGYISTEVAGVYEADALEDLNRAVADAALWADDQWVRRWSPTSGPARTSLADHAGRASGALVEMRRIVDARFEVHRDGLVVDRDRVAQSRTGFLVFAGCFAILGLLLLAHALRTVVRRARLIAIDSEIDPLTGLGNRKRLDRAVAAQLSNPLLTHHVMITIDMDRFKFVNDVHGHGFGDRMLEVMGVGLTALSKHLEGVTGTAIRIGGDEFLVSFHSSSEIDIDRLRRVLERLRATLLSAPDGTLVRCRFSFGLIVAEGSPELRSLMAASDLAAYEDKARTDTPLANS